MRLKMVAYRAVDRRSDVELRRLRTLRRSYAKDTGPEILLFGDSAMIWKTPLDPKGSTLVDMIRNELGGDVEIVTLAGPGYNPRIVSAFLTALDGCRSRPAVIVAPTSVLMATTLWSESPAHGYHHESKSLRWIIARDGKPPLKGIERAPGEEYEAYDRRPAPSLFGARRTVGEIRLILNSVPTTRWATAVRMRHVMDYYFAERLEPDSPGVGLVKDLGAQVARLKIPTVAYVAPASPQILRTTLGEGSLEHVERNVRIIESAFLEASDGYGHVVNAIFECPSEEFIDPAHLTYQGRERLSRHMAAAIGPLLNKVSTL